MKHSLRITILLILFYLIAQVTGLALLSNEIQVDNVDGDLKTSYGETALGERPQLSGASTIVYLAIGVGIGTGLLLVLIKFQQVRLWKAWFFLASALAMALALGAVLPAWVALVVAVAIAVLKIFRPNVFVHNISEILMYAGLAVFFVPMIEVWWGVVLLVIFSVYDAYAVWKSEHMVKMAEFQSSSKLFAGLTLPYDTESGAVQSMPDERQRDELHVPERVERSASKQRTAILGGGDIAFPLLFAGSVMQWLLVQGASKLSALLQSSVVSVTSALALFGLFTFAKKDAFYPAMPFITAGCLLGWGIVYVI